ncbi:MAG: asparagine synthetase B, partial [Gelidibacter sp.]
FTMPFEKWFREDLKDYVLTELDQDSLNEIPSVNAKEATSKIKSHLDGNSNEYPLIWTLLILKQWLNTNGKGISIK